MHAGLRAGCQLAVLWLAVASWEEVCVVFQQGRLGRYGGVLVVAAHARGRLRSLSLLPRILAGGRGVHEVGRCRDGEGLLIEKRLSGRDVHRPVLVV